MKKKKEKNLTEHGMPEKDITSESYLQTVFRRFKKHKLGMISLIVFIILGLAALFAPVLAPYDPNEIAGSFSGAPSGSFFLEQIRSEGMSLADFFMP